MRPKDFIQIKAESEVKKVISFMALDLLFVLNGCQIGN